MKSFVQLERIRKENTNNRSFGADMRVSLINDGPDYYNYRIAKTMK
jgi:D-Tyr-tRNAtyr deacylase